MRQLTIALPALALSVTLSNGASGTLERAPLLAMERELVRAPGGSDTTGERRTLDDWARGAQIFPSMGDFHREITSRSPEARAYFDQGMRFLWVFNHDEASRSFARAAQLDPECASCYWGLALTLGPNYNMQMMAPARSAAAWEALSKARQYAPRTTPVEQALIRALAQRYEGPQTPSAERAATALTGYAGEMRKVARQFPSDLDVQTLFAEALMNTMPWKLWNADGSPAPVTNEIVATLEAVLHKDPMHPGANHYYIHAVESSLRPERAMPSAERVGAMMPAAGHLVHMPAHIMQRVGRYEDAAEANRRAAAADDRYYTKTRAIDYYPVVYSAHNYQFLASAAAMEGRSRETIRAMRSARAVLSDRLLLRMPGADWSLAYLYEGMIRFGRWEMILHEPAPNAHMTGLVVGYLEARAAALAARGRLADAKSTVASLDEAIASTPEDGVAGMNAAPPVYKIASLRAKARIAKAERKRSLAIALLRQAVSEEDQLAYDEPADEFFPTRHLLGAALLDGGFAHEAETVYREDLRRYPANGWSLYGLSRALEAQGHTREAAVERRLFAHAWRHADVAIRSSAF
ncbi:MAG: hypothetical protein ABI889_15175 [Gemmatimonadota bacterium]